LSYLANNKLQSLVSNIYSYRTNEQ
jgi:hypothetical protein